MPDKVRVLEAHHAQTDAGANTLRTATLPASTVDGVFTYLTGLYAELVSIGAPAAGSVALTLAGLENSLTLTLSRTAVAAVVCDSLLINFTSPVRASAAKTAIVLSGNSGDANTTLRITLFGYQAMGK